jgi:hypothetical protein
VVVVEEVVLVQAVEVGLAEVMEAMVLVLLPDSDTLFWDVL